MINDQTIDDNDLSVSLLLRAAFEVAFSREPELHKTWIGISHKIGSRIGPASIRTVQFIGQLDLLLRAMEADRAAAMRKQLETIDYELTFQADLSDNWIGSTYEVFRILNTRFEEEEVVKSLHHSLRLLRVPIEKYQIAGDRKLKEVLALGRYPEVGQSGSVTYDKHDPMRTHIMPQKLSNRGSVEWCATDVEGQKQQWLERQELSDAIVAYGQNLS